MEKQEGSYRYENGIGGDQYNRCYHRGVAERRNPAASDSINPGSVEDAFPSGDYDQSKDSLYRQAILAWENENTNMMMDYTQISAEYRDYALGKK